MNRKSLVDATPGTDDLPDLFDNTQAMVFEIDAALRKARGAVIDLGWARVARSLEGMQAAHAELAKLLQQATTLSQSLDRVLKFHKARR